MTEALQELAVVSLVGKQPMPNLIINLEYLPKESFFLCTDDKRYEVPNEIDVLFTKDNHLGVCSCKTRREARIDGELYSEHIAAYETISRTLGGIFTKVFLISSEEIPESSGTYQRAKSLQAEIVNPKQFPNLYQMLENIAWKSL